MFFFILTGLFFIGCQKSASHLSEAEKNEITKQIEAIHNEISQAFNEHDVAKILSFIDQNEDLHYVEHTHVTIGWDTLKKGLEEWHPVNQNLSGKSNYFYVNVLSKDIAVLVSSGVIYRENIAFLNMTYTAVFQRKENGWKIVNAHEAFSEIEH